MSEILNKNINKTKLSNSIKTDIFFQISRQYVFINRHRHYTEKKTLKNLPT